MSIRTLLLTLVVALGIARSSKASLVVGDFLNPGDDLLVTDTSTGLEWLTPVYTKDQTYDDSFVQNLIATYGFAYATEAQVEDMINSNFGNPPTSSPGTAAGYSDVQSFFGIYGIADGTTSCGGPCPRTQGLTSTSPQSNYQDAVGMIQLGSDGWEIEDNAWPDNISDRQMGSWLIRSDVSAAAPEPGTLGLLALGLLVVVPALRQRLHTRPKASISRI